MSNVFFVECILVIPIRSPNDFGRAMGASNVVAMTTSITPGIWSQDRKKPITPMIIPRTQIPANGAAILDACLWFKGLWFSVKDSVEIHSTYNH